MDETYQASAIMTGGYVVHFRHEVERSRVTVQLRDADGTMREEVFVSERVVAGIQAGIQAGMGEDWGAGLDDDRCEYPCLYCEHKHSVAGHCPDCDCELRPEQFGFRRCTECGLTYDTKNTHACQPVNGPSCWGLPYECPHCCRDLRTVADQRTQIQCPGCQLTFTVWVEGAVVKWEV